MGENSLKDCDCDDENAYGTMQSWDLQIASNLFLGRIL